MVSIEDIDAVVGLMLERAEPIAQVLAREALPAQQRRAGHGAADRRLFCLRGSAASDQRDGAADCRARDAGLRGRAGSAARRARPRAGARYRRRHRPAAVRQFRRRWFCGAQPGSRSHGETTAQGRRPRHRRTPAGDARFGPDRRRASSPARRCRPAPIRCSCRRIAASRATPCCCRRASSRRQPPARRRGRARGQRRAAAPAGGSPRSISRSQPPSA